MTSVHERVSGLLSGRVARGFMLLFVGTGAGQFLAMLFSPVVSRLYTPEQFGVLGVFSGVASVLAVVAALRYEIAIIIPVKDIDAAEILVGGCVIVLSLSLLCAAILVILYAMGGFPVFLEPARPLLWLVPIAQLGTGLQCLFLNWALRKRAFGRIARAKLWQGILLVGAQLVLGGLHCGAFGLVVAFVLGQGAGLTPLAFACWRDDRDSFLGLSMRDIVRRTRQFWRFPIYSSPAALINALGTNLPQIAITGLFGTSAGGAYTFATRIFMTPGNLVAQSLFQVFSVEFASTIGESKQRAQRLFSKVAISSMIPALGIAVAAFAAPLWFTFVFGQRWQSAALFSQFLAPAFAMMVLCVPVTSFELTGRNSWLLYWNVLRFAAVAAALWVGEARYRNAAWAIILLSASMFAAYAIGGMMSWEAVRRYRSSSGSVSEAAMAQ